MTTEMNARRRDEPTFPYMPGNDMPPDASDDEKLAGRLPTLSIIVPALNEEATIGRILRRVFEAPLPCRREVIVVDDGSTDRTAEVAQEHASAGRLRLIRLRGPSGKGMAVRAGIAAANGDFVVVQDADEEYDPRDLAAIVMPLMDGRVQAVYGSRVINEHITTRWRWLSPFWCGGRSLTLIANLLFPGLWISDEPVCYKAVRLDLLMTIPLRCRGFEFCPELTAKLARRGVQIWNVPIRYAPRGIRAGKKIRARHWFQAVLSLLHWRLAADHGPVAGAGKHVPVTVIEDTGPTSPLPATWPLQRDTSWKRPD